MGTRICLRSSPTELSHRRQSDSFDSFRRLQLVGTIESPPPEVIDRRYAQFGKSTTPASDPMFSGAVCERDFRARTCSHARCMSSTWYPGTESPRRQDAHCGHRDSPCAFPTKFEPAFDLFWCCPLQVNDSDDKPIHRTQRAVEQVDAGPPCGGVSSGAGTF